MSALLFPAFSRPSRPALRARHSGDEPGLSRVRYADTSGSTQKIHESLVICAYTLIMLGRGQIPHLRTAPNETIGITAISVLGRRVKRHPVIWVRAAMVAPGAADLSLLDAAPIRHLALR
mgnify:CR=1 FL=1|jgi:hypothetical protein